MMVSGYAVIQTQIEKQVQWIRKGHVGVASVVDKELYLGAERIISPWYWVLQRQSTWQMAWPYTNLFVFKKF